MSTQVAQGLFVLPVSSSFPVRSLVDPVDGEPNPGKTIWTKKSKGKDRSSHLLSLNDNLLGLYDSGISP